MRGASFVSLTQQFNTSHDHVLAEDHRRMLSPPRRKGEPIDVPLMTALAHIEEADAGITASSVMSREERIAVLSNAAAFDRLLALPLTENDQRPLPPG